MEGSDWQPPSWMYREGRPPNDDMYFESMTRIVFQAGLSWKMITKKWPDFRKAFENFSIEKVAKFDKSDLERLLTDKGIVRNRRKIEATISNAKEFQRIKRQFGSFQSYLDSLGKSQNYASAIKELSRQFRHVGPSSARIFLYSVGEDVRHPDE